MLEKVKQWTSEHKALSLVFLLVICLFVVPQTCHAWEWLNSLAGSAASSAAEKAFSLIMYIVALLVEFVAWIFTWVVDIFLGFARYNDFANAAPVKLGWVIVRDICNMFFIVVLLISAFSTIIGWDSSMRYNAVVPKLLLMAILINFSRTLIQVLIDFSQVIMLTFVNAFRAAGAGNFTSAFRVNKLLNMKDDVQARASGANASILDAGTRDIAGQVFASFLLALVLIIIATGVMIIMTAYVLARIIGLWVALIFSPAAFFITALPSRLQSGLSSFSGKYWSRLGGMLTGGPVVMFFIYLTFAILQTSPAPPADTTPPATGQQAGQTPPTASEAGSGTGLSGQLGLYHPTLTEQGGQFITAVGTSDDVASFIVAVALMLMALEAAVEAASAVDSTVGKFASSVGSASKGLAFGAAALAASSPWIASKFLGRGIDKRYDLTGKAATAALWTTNKIPLAGQYARPFLMRKMMERTREAQTERAELKTARAGMTERQNRLVEAGQHSTVGTIAGNLADKVVNLAPEGSKRRRVMSALRSGLGGAWHTKGEKLALMDTAGDLASEATGAEVQRNEENRIEAALEREDIQRQAADPNYQKRSKVEIGKIAENRAADVVRQRRAEQLNVQEVQAKRLNDHATLDAIKAARKKDPLLWTDPGKRQEKIDDISQNIEKIKQIDEPVRLNTALLTGLMLSRGVAQRGANGTVAITDDKILRDKLIEDVAGQDKKMAKALDAFIRLMQNSSVTNAKTGVVTPGMAENVATQGRMETDANGDIRFARTPAAGTTVLGKAGEALTKAVPVLGKIPLIGEATGISLMGEGGMGELTAATGGAGGRILRSTNEQGALDALKELGKNNAMTDPAATIALRGFLDANGSIADLKEIPNIQQAFQQFGTELAQQFQATLAFDGNQLRPAAGQEQNHQELLKSLRFVQQLNNQGVDQGSADAVFQALATSMTVNGVGGAAAQNFRLADMFAYRSSAPTAKKGLDDPAFALFSAAKRRGGAQGSPAADVLERVQEIHYSSSDQERKRENPSARRALELEVDT